MKNVFCQPYLLSSFFHRIFYNVDDLFIFKKQFTTTAGHLLVNDEPVAALAAGDIDPTQIVKVDK